MANTQEEVLELEGMVSTLTVLRVLSTDMGALRLALRSKVSQMPGFFQDAPIALDLSELEPEAEAEAVAPMADLSLEKLVAMVRAEKLSPVALRNARSERKKEAAALGLACMRASSRSVRSKKPESPVVRVDPSKYDKHAPAPVAEMTPALILQQPVRGGQVVYAEQCDAIVLSSVNSGGELIADGNIHVYGALRGRALAGAHGNEQARIFCQSLQADLVSIAGTYLRADEIPEEVRGKAAQISLVEDALVVTPL